MYTIIESINGKKVFALDFKGKKLLILGANPETAGLVKKANEMGIYTIVTDYDPNAYAKQFASKAINIDAVDVDALYEFAVSEKVDAVMVGVAELLLTTYQKLCERLGFPYYAEARIFELMTDKQLFKNACREYDVPVVEEYFVDLNDESTFANVKLPVVVKPVDSCSSKGISVCKTEAELREGVEKALSFSQSNRILIEKYMTGEEVVLYYTFNDGEPILTAMCDRYTNKEQKGVAQLPTSYIFPSRHLKKYMEETDEKVKNMFRSLGVKNGITFIQSFVDEDGGVRFYEPGFRLNGAQEHYIVNEMTGIDGREMMINFAFTGKMSDDDIAAKANPVFPKWGCMLSPLVRTAKIAKIDGLDEIAKFPGVVSINPNYRVGENVVGLGTLKQVICRFYIVADTRQELKAIIDRIHETLVVEDEDGESMFLKVFDSETLNINYNN